MVICRNDIVFRGSGIVRLVNDIVFRRENIAGITLMTSQGSDTVTSIFKCNSSNTFKSLRRMKIA